MPLFFNTSYYYRSAEHSSRSAILYYCISLQNSRESRLPLGLERKVCSGQASCVPPQLQLAANLAHESQGRARGTRGGTKEVKSSRSKPSPTSRIQAWCPLGWRQGTEGPGTGTQRWEGPPERVPGAAAGWASLSASRTRPVGPEAAAGPDLAEDKLPRGQHQQQEGAASEGRRKFTLDKCDVKCIT